MADIEGMELDQLSQAIALRLHTQSGMERTPDEVHKFAECQAHIPGAVFMHAVDYLRLVHADQDIYNIVVQMLRRHRHGIAAHLEGDHLSATGTCRKCGEMFVMLPGDQVHKDKRGLYCREHGRGKVATYRP